MLYQELAELLYEIGWRSDCDAQHTNLRDALPRIAHMLSAETRLKHALAELEDTASSLENTLEPMVVALARPLRRAVKELEIKS